jgi:hypothetical protein
MNQATQIARDWNVKASGAGFVTRFDVAPSISVGFRFGFVNLRHDLPFAPVDDDLYGIRSRVMANGVCSGFGESNQHGVKIRKEYSFLIFRQRFAQSATRFQETRRDRRHCLPTVRSIEPLCRLTPQGS